MLFSPQRVQFSQTQRDFDGDRTHLSRITGSLPGQCFEESAERDFHRRTVLEDLTYRGERFVDLPRSGKFPRRIHRLADLCCRIGRRDRFCILSERSCGDRQHKQARESRSFHPASPFTISSSAL